MNEFMTGRILSGLVIIDHSIVCTHYNEYTIVCI